jgi:hypothetical protein
MVQAIIPVAAGQGRAKLQRGRNTRARHEHDACRLALISRVETTETHAFERKLIEGWRLDLAAEGSQVREPHVVGDDKENIGTVVDGLSVANSPDRQSTGKKQ